MSRAVRRRSWALVAGALLFFVAFWKLRLYDPGVELDIASIDTYAQLLPMWERAAVWMRAGHLPLWNPYQACGHPFLASLLYGVLYPMHAAWLVLDPAVVLEISTVLHLFLAWLFTYLFVRACGSSRLAGAVAGLAFALCGILMQEAIWYAPAVDSAVWLPLGLFAVEKLLRQRRWKWLVVLAVAVAMPVYAGWLQNFLYFAQALALYTAVRLIAVLRGAGGWRTAAAAAAMITGGVLLGLALSAAQLLPSLELTELGTRGSGELSVHAMFLYPAPTPGALLAQAFDARPGAPRLSYVGVVPLLLLPAILWTRRRRRAPVAALFVVAGFGLLAMFTLYTPFWNVYGALPGVSRFRIPWRVALVYAFATSALAGFAFDALGRAQPRQRRLIAAACAALALLALAAIDMPWISRGYLLAGIAAIAAATWLPSPRLRRLARTGLAALIAAELFLATWSVAIHPIRDVSMYDKEEALFALLRQEAGLDRVYIHPIGPAALEVTPKVATLHEVFTITNYENLSLQRQSFFFAGMDPLVRRIGYYPLPFDGGFHVEAEPDNLRMIAQLSVRFFAVAKDNAPYRQVLEQAGWRLAFSPERSAFAVYENPRPLPRAYVSSNFISLDDAAAVKMIWRPRFNPFRVTVVEPPPGETLTNIQSGPPIVPATITRYEPTRVDIDTDSELPGFLVLTDTDYPGWRAEVDGAPVKIATANYLFRAVPVDAGRHTVTFTYAPASVRWGFAITAAALLVGLGGLFVPGGRREARPSGRAGLPMSGR